MTDDRIGQWLNDLADRPRADPLFCDGKSVWIYGAGKFAGALFIGLERVGVPVAGFFVTSGMQAEHLGKPVKLLSQYKDSGCKQVIIGVFNRESAYIDLVNNLRQVGVESIYFPWDLCPVIGQITTNCYWLADKSLFLANQGAIRMAYSALADQSSKELFVRICRFRTGDDIDYSGYRDTSPQYFNELMSSWVQARKEAWVFVDGGAYDGDTFMQLVAIAPKVTAYLFEPDINNFVSLTTRVSTLSRHRGEAVCLPLGLSNSSKLVSFNGVAGEAACIDDFGIQTAMVCTLDSVFSGAWVDFIKLDVEGAELQALEGGLSVIRRCRPALAVSLYHKPADLWELVNWINDLGIGYEMYIRQHFFNSFDSVLYAFPREN